MGNRVDTNQRYVYISREDFEVALELMGDYRPHKSVNDSFSEISLYWELESEDKESREVQLKVRGMYRSPGAKSRDEVFYANSKYFNEIRFSLWVFDNFAYYGKDSRKFSEEDSPQLRFAKEFCDLIGIPELNWN